MAGEVSQRGNPEPKAQADAAGKEGVFSTADGQDAQATGEVDPCPFDSAVTAAVSPRRATTTLNAAGHTSVRSPEGVEQRREQQAREATTLCTRS
jgi:hypothetical protein